MQNNIIIRKVHKHLSNQSHLYLQVFKIVISKGCIHDWSNRPGLFSLWFLDQVNNPIINKHQYHKTGENTSRLLFGYAYLKLR
jgi:hypothetical protein